jgi:hypothetical protein
MYRAHSAAGARNTTGNLHVLRLLLSVANSVRREGAPWNPHDHSELQTVVTVSDDTAGLDVTASSPAGFPARDDRDDERARP